MVKRWKRTIALTEEYKKVYDAFANQRRAENKERKASKVSAHGEKPAETKPAPKVVATAPVKAAPVKTAPAKIAPVKVAPAKVEKPKAK
jgi:hypothetical protein